MSPTVVNRVRAAYHAWVPDRVRYPIGHARRSLLDRVLRWRTARPVPPSSKLQSVQMTPWAREYLEVGARCAATIEAILGPALIRGGTVTQGTDSQLPRVLDFGSGLGRTARHLETFGWHLFGCDVDHGAIAWSSRALPTISHAITDHAPPLPFAPGVFDGLYAVSVFTHFDATSQTLWARELARITRPGATVILSTMGTHALGNFAQIDGPDPRRALQQDGFYFHPAGETFNASGAFHTQDGIARIFAPWFRLVHWQSAGLDGFQDLSHLERRSQVLDPTRRRA